MVNEKEVMKYFSSYAVQRMDELDLKPWYVAYYSETSEPTFRNYLKSIRLPRPSTLIMSSELFGCTVNELLGYKRVSVPRRIRTFDSGLDTRNLSEHFYSEVSRRMVRKRITLDELAIYTCTAVLTLDNNFRRNSLPDTSMILAICSALECTPSDLLGY